MPVAAEGPNRLPAEEKDELGGRIAWQLVELARFTHRVGCDIRIIEEFLRDLLDLPFGFGEPDVLS